MFIEKAVTSLISPYLEEGQDTVSSEINIKHFKPVGLGNKVRCIVHLKYVEGRKLFFDIAVFDENHEEVAIGAHCRHIINLVDFRPHLNSVEWDFTRVFGLPGCWYPCLFFLHVYLM